MLKLAAELLQPLYVAITSKSAFWKTTSVLTPWKGKISPLPVPNPLLLAGPKVIGEIETLSICQL